jgi:hypothetical protein
LDVIARPKPGSLKPAAREADFGFDQPLPRIAIGLDLQQADGHTWPTPIERIIWLHNAPLDKEPALAPVHPTAGCT